MAKEIRTTGELRKFLANTAVGVVQGDVKPDKAAIAVKACKEVNASLYSEIKAASIAKAAGKEAAELGKLPITDESVTN